MDQVKYHLEHLTEYAVDWYKMLKTKFGEGEREKPNLERLIQLMNLRLQLRTLSFT